MYRCSLRCCPSLRSAANARTGSHTRPASSSHPSDHPQTPWLNPLFPEEGSLARNDSGKKNVHAPKFENIVAHARHQSRAKEPTIFEPSHDRLNNSVRPSFSLSPTEVRAITYRYQSLQFEHGRNPKFISIALRLRREISVSNAKVGRSLYWMVNYPLVRWAAEKEKSRDVQKALSFFTRESDHWLKHGTFLRGTASKRPLGLKLDVLLGCLMTSAEAALAALSSSYQLHFPIRADCLFYLRNSLWDEVQARPEQEELFWREVDMLRDTSIWPPTLMLDRHLDLLLQNAPEDQQRELVKHYLDKYPSPPDQALLYLVDVSTRLKDVDMALSLLKRVTPETLQRLEEDIPEEKNSLPVAKRCTKLLQLESIERDGYTQSFKILPQILHLGVPPDTVMYNLIIRNAVRLELPAIGWDIFQYAREQGVRLDEITHLMLLKDSFTRKDTPRVNEMLSILQERPDLSQFPRIAGYMMYIVMTLCRRQHSLGAGETWRRILNVYDHTWNRRSLIKAGLLKESQDNVKSSALQDPPPESLAFVIFCYLASQKDEPRVNRLWEHLTERLDDGDQELRAAAHHPAFFVGFIAFYGRRHKSLSKASGILHVLLQNEWCVVNDLTWSITIGVFLKHGQIEAAEKIWRLRLQKNRLLPADIWNFHLERFPDTEVGSQIRDALDVSWDGEDGGLGIPTEDSGISETAAVEEITSIEDTGLPQSGVFAGPAPNQEWKSMKWDSESDLDSIISLATKKAEEHSPA